MHNKYDPPLPYETKAIFTGRALLHVYHKWHFKSISLSEMSVNAQLQLTARERVENVKGFVYKAFFMTLSHAIGSGSCVDILFLKSLCSSCYCITRKSIKPHVNLSLSSVPFSFYKYFCNCETTKKHGGGIISYIGNTFFWSNK